MKPKKAAPTFLSQRLRELRTTAGMTQKEVAEHLEIHRSTYAYYETGAIEPSLPLLQRIAAEYRVTTGYLLGNENTDSSLSMRQDTPNPMEGAELMSQCTREERTFLSLLRRMDDSKRRQLQAYCLDILLASPSTLADNAQDMLEQHIHTINEWLPTDEP